MEARIKNDETWCQWRIKKEKKTDGLILNIKSGLHFVHGTKVAAKSGIPFRLRETWLLVSFHGHRTEIQTETPKMISAATLGD